MKKAYEKLPQSSPESSSSQDLLEMSALTKKSVLEIEGMTCSSCTSSVTKALQNFSEVKDVSVSLMTNQAVVFHSVSLDASLLVSAVENVGFDARLVSSSITNNADSAASNANNSNTVISIQGMTCSACVESVTSALTAVAGVQEAKVSLLTEEAVVNHSREISPDSLVNAIEDCGFDASVSSTSNCAGSAVTTVSVGGMTCSSCVQSVTSAIESVEGVDSVSVSLLAEQAIVKHSSSLDPKAVVDAVEDCGFDASIENTAVEDSSSSASAAENVDLRYYGTPTLPLTPESLKACLLELSSSGIFACSVNNDDSTLSISYNPSLVGIRNVFTAIRDSFDVDLLIMNGMSDVNTSQLKLLAKYKEIIFWKKSFFKSLICGLPVFFMSHFDLSFLKCRIIPGLYLDNVLCWGLASYTQYSVGKHFYVSAYKSLKHSSATMDVLVVTSTTVSYVFSVLSILYSVILASSSSPMLLFDTAAMLFIFISLGKWLESKAKGQTTSSLSELMKLIPYKCDIVEDSANFIAQSQKNDGKFTPSDYATKSVSADLVQFNDVILVKPGENIPTDGVVIYGESEVNESLLTGESLPMLKTPGSSVIGGSVNIANILYLQVNKVGHQTVLSKIIDLVRNAQFQKAPIQRYSDYIASKFVPFIIALSIFTFFFWYVLVKFAWVSETRGYYPSIFVMNKQNGVFFNCLKIAISVVVIACPCALGLAAPTAIMAGTGIGAKNGILIKGGDIFETLTRVDSVLFDKTNTLTTGKMSMVDFNLDLQSAKETHGLSEPQIWSIIGKVESNNGHPISKAICNFVESKVSGFNFDCSVVKVENVISKGVTGSVQVGDKLFNVKIGNRKLVENNRVDENVGSTIYISINDTYLGHLVLADQIKYDAKEVIRALHHENIETSMVTGDNYQISKTIANSLGISLANVFAEVSPDGKQEIVSNFQEAGKTVLFVGDGINDAAAISASNIGVSFSESTEIAASAANVILLDDSSLTPLVMALELSRQTFHTIKLNFLLASIYNLLMIPMAMGGVVHPLLAAGAMSMSSVCVVGNSLRLNRWKPRKV